MTRQEWSDWTPPPLMGRPGPINTFRYQRLLEEYVLAAESSQNGANGLTKEFNKLLSGTGKFLGAAEKKTSGFQTKFRTDLRDAQSDLRTIFPSILSNANQY